MMYTFYKTWRKNYQSGSRKMTVFGRGKFRYWRLAEKLADCRPFPESGKTTLLGDCCADWILASTGSVNLNGNEWKTLSEDQRAAVRNQNVGIIFQKFSKLAFAHSYSIWENVGMRATRNT